MLGIVTLTTGGLTLAKSIAEKMPSKVYFKPKPFKETVHALYKEYDQLLFIMATGIVVRTLASVLEHKSKDPAIIVMDEKGQHVISLLSGHLGGANQLSTELAQITSGSPVITTASDVNGLLSVDMLAEKYDLVLEDFDGAKEVTAALLDGGKIQVVGMIVHEKQYISVTGDAVLYVGHNPKSYDQVSVQLKPKNLILSMGCRRNTNVLELKDFVMKSLDMFGYSSGCLIELTSAWIKEDETGLIELSKQLKIPFTTHSKESILGVSEQFEGSEFVCKTLGVPCVSEPCGYLSSRQGLCLIKKRKHNGMTLSLWQRG
ncbi:MAG: cobalt-precorrin 5A hydrolase [Clostridiales bacterium]|nr:cobalt-precorrin 5A hydrolase [Clostridiales bacterium]